MGYGTHVYGGAVYGGDGASSLVRNSLAGKPLTRPEVSEFRLETTVWDLFEEFLSGYFDGAAHDIGPTLDLPFPRATLRFQQSRQPQPLKGISISGSWDRTGQWKRDWEAFDGARQQVATGNCLWRFWVRAEVVDKGAGNSRQQCMEAAELLYGLLSNSAATVTLAAKGIQHLRTGNPELVSYNSGGPSNSDGTDYVLRVVQVSGRVRYAVMSQAAGII
jgi:hypothetical protein